MQAEHEHHHPQGPFFEAAFAVSMLFGRGGLARAVSRLATLSPTDVVVDVGCGPGAAARRARRDGAGRSVGIDPNPKMLRLARSLTSLRGMEGVTFEEGSAESLPLDSSSATVLWAIQSVHHWVDRRKGLEESRRVLAAGGRMLLAERSVIPGARGRAAHGITGPATDELVGLVAEVGFADVERQMIPVGRRNLVVVNATAPMP
jgi:SAM-dependent methyltransferase